MSFSMKIYFYFTILLIQVLCTISTAPAQTILPAEDIAEKALAATVYLEMKDANGKTLGIGSGFFVKPNLIATNYHVIEGAAKGTAKLVGKSTTYNIEGVTATDKTNDLAILKVTALGIKPLSLGDSDKVRTGETVYVAGNPKGLEGTFSNGIISSKRSEDTKERLQMTAPISPGSSGGPVLNKKGEVIGVSFMTLEGGQNLNFAIPSEYLKKLLQQSKLAKPLSQGKQSISAETYLLWGIVRHELGDYKSAITYYTKAINLKLNTAVIYALRGLSKLHFEQFHSAIADYDKAIQLKPNYAEAYLNRGFVKSRLGNQYAAIADYDKAIQLKSNYAEAYANRGIAHGKLGRYKQAINDCTMAIKLNPDIPDAYLGLGMAKTMLGEFKDAIGNFNNALILKPDFFEAYNARAFAKINQNQNVSAIDDCNKAIQLNPDFAEAYLTRGYAKGQLGQTQKAQLDFQIAFKLAEKAGNTKLKVQIKELIRILE